MVKPKLTTTYGHVKGEGWCVSVWQHMPGKLYTGKSVIMRRIQARVPLARTEMYQELRVREELLELVRIRLMDK